MAKLAKGRAKSGGRRKGTPNKTTSVIKDALIAAAEAVGADGNGAGGLTGYLTSLATVEPRAFASLLGRVIPLQVSGPNGEPLAPLVVPILAIPPHDPDADPA